MVLIEPLLPGSRRFTAENIFFCIANWQHPPWGGHAAGKSPFVLADQCVGIICGNVMVVTSMRAGFISSTDIRLWQLKQWWCSHAILFSFPFSIASSAASLQFLYGAQCLPRCTSRNSTGLEVPSAAKKASKNARYYADHDWYCSEVAAEFYL